MHTNKNHFLAILFLIVCSTGYLFDVLFLGKHLSAFDFLLEKPSWSIEVGKVKAKNTMLSDSPTAHYPYKKEFWEAAKQGYNPQYLPHIFSGKPTSGQGVGIFSTSLFQFFMDIPNALDFSTWFRMILAGLLMYVFLFQLGVGSAAASLGAVAWTFNMHQIAWLMFPQHLATQLWLPLLLGLNLLVLRLKTNIAAILALIVTVVFFFTSGYTQIVLYTFIFLGVFNTFYILIVSEDKFGQKLINWIRIHAIYLLAGLILLPDALWQAEDIADGLRGTQDFRYNRYNLDLSVAAFIQLAKDLLPNSTEVVRFLTPNYLSDLGQIPAIKDFTKSNVVEFQVYFGLISLFLTIYGITKSFTEKNRLLIVLVIMLFLVIALFNGNETIISLLNLIPFAGSGTYSRIITLLLLVAITIAAFGAKFLIEDLNENRYFHLVISLSIILFWLSAAKYTYPALLALREFLPWLVYLGLVLFASLLMARFKQARFVLPLMVVLTFAELFLTGSKFNTRLEAKNHFPMNSIIQQIRTTDGDFRTALLMDHTGYHHNILSYYDLSTLGGYETTAPNDYLYFMREAYKKVHVTLNGILFLFDGKLEILRLLNTRFIISNLDLKNDLIEPIYSNERETLYEFKNHLGRAYCASDQIIQVEPLIIPNELAKLSTKYDRPVILTEPIIDQSSLTNDCLIKDLKVYTSKLVFTVESDQPSIVFIPVNYHKYWQAQINSNDVEISKANYTFMALKVDSGTSSIELQFINSKLTVAAILLLVLGMVTILVAIFRVNSGWQKVAFVICGILLIGKSMMSIPGIMNTDIHEKPILIDTKL